MKKGIIKNLLLLFIIFSSLTLLSCSNTSKKITVSEDTKEEISLEEKEIIKSISAGEKLLDENKFDEAKEAFNRAINFDKSNKDTYIRIKDKYLSMNKADDAYSIIKTAISNNVDIDNMKIILKEISSKFEVIKISNSVYQNDNYALPKQVIINVSDNSMTIPITWDNEKVDTSNLGTLTYEGYNDEYGRKIVAELTVLENVYDKQIGWLKNLYEKNGEIYIDIDLVEFYLGREEALREAIKDGKAGIDENGEYFLPDPVWIRNNSDSIFTYQVSSDSSYSLCGYNTTPNDPYDRGLVSKVSYDEFLNVFNKTKTNESRILLVWIDIKNGSISKITEQFLP